MKLWLSDGNYEVAVYAASDGTVSDRQLLRALRRLGAPLAEIILRRGRHTEHTGRYAMAVLERPHAPNRRHCLLDPARLSPVAERT